jgi:hypothetical protein
MLIIKGRASLRDACKQTNKLGCFLILHALGYPKSVPQHDVAHVYHCAMSSERDSFAKGKFSTFAKGFLLHKLLLKVNYSPLRVKKSRSHDMGHYHSRLSSSFVSLRPDNNWDMNFKSLYAGGLGWILRATRLKILPVLTREPYTSLLHILLK